MKVIKIKEQTTGTVIHEVDVTNKSERTIDRIVDGMMINLDHTNYWIDNTCIEEETRPLIE